MTRRRYRLFALLLVFSLIAAACGNSGDDSDDSADVGDDTTEPADDEPEGDDEPADDTTEPEGDDEPADDTTEPEGDDTTEPEIDRTTFISIEGVPGVSDTEIGAAVIGLRSGNPLGTCILDCYVTGIQAYFDYQNSLGGVFGRDLVLAEILDDELVQHQVRALEVIANEDSFVAFSAGLVASGFGDLHDAGVPTFVWGIQAPELQGRDSLFGHLGTTCGDCTSRGVPYQVQLVGATKVAALGYGISPESQTCSRNMATSVDLYSADIGAETVKIYDDLAFGLPNGIAPQVTEMIELGVDFIASCLDLNAMKTIAQEFERQGYRDQITMQHPNTYDADFVAEAGSLFDGDFVSPQFVPFEYEGIEALDTYFEWVEANGGQVAEQTMVGWINADLYVDGLIATGPDFNREKLLTTINTEFTAHSANGLINPIDWTRQHVAATDEDRVTNGFVDECLALVQMQDGAFHTVTEEPFLCWSNASTDWSVPVETSFTE